MGKVIVLTTTTDTRRNLKLALISGILLPPTWVILFIVINSSEPHCIVKEAAALPVVKQI